MTKFDTKRLGRLAPGNSVHTFYTATRALNYADSVASVLRCGFHRLRHAARTAGTALTSAVVMSPPPNASAPTPNSFAKEPDDQRDRCLSFYLSFFSLGKRFRIQIARPTRKRLRRQRPCRHPSIRADAEINKESNLLLSAV